MKLDDAKKELVVTRQDDEKQSKALHGLTRALLANMVKGVTKGYQQGRWRSRASATRPSCKGKNLVLSVGFANPVAMDDSRRT